MNTKPERKLGWLRGLADIRDYNANEVAAVKKKITVPGEHLLTEKYFPPIEDQGNLGSCTANAATGMVEYMERKASNTHTDMSRLFLYKVTRKLMGVTGDTGAYLRDTMKALRTFGAPPERNYPYDITKFDAEPSAYHYAMAANYKSLKYMRVDQPGMTGLEIVEAVKTQSARGYPMMFGFTCYESLYSPEADAGNIPFPAPTEQVIGGHAMDIVGYSTKKAALRIRNSWGTSWGDKGYGWLPFNYIYAGLLDDIWLVTKQEWIDLKIFD